MWYNIKAEIWRTKYLMGHYPLGSISTSFRLFLSLFQSFLTKSQMEFNSLSNGSRLLFNKVCNRPGIVYKDFNDPEIDLRLNNGK